MTLEGFCTRKKMVTTRVGRISQMNKIIR